MLEAITNLNLIWDKTKKILSERDYFDAVVFDTYFEDTRLYKINGETAIVVVFNQTAKSNS